MKNQNEKTINNNENLALQLLKRLGRRKTDKFSYFPTFKFDNYTRNKIVTRQTSSDFILILALY